MDANSIVRAEYDNEAGVWVAEGQNFPGLVTEAATLDELSAKLEIMVPESLELNGLLPAGGGGEAVRYDLVAALGTARQHRSEAV